MSGTDFQNKPLYEYDVALSFASEDREYVEDTAFILRSYGVKVFYDKFEEADLWGKDLFAHLKEVYSKRAKYTIMFISEHYKNKLWTTHERKSIQERAFKESEEYILPVRFDNTEIPGLYETIGYIDLKTKTPSELTDLVIKKLKWEISNRWWGYWKLNSHKALYHGAVFINPIDTNGFYFKLYNVNGAHCGEVEGRATFKSKNEAVFVSNQYEDRPDRQCTIKFTKTNDILQIIEDSCQHYHGMRSHFDGDYALKKDIFYDLNIFDDLLLSRVYALLKNKEHWDKFSEAFNDIHIDDENQEFNGRIITGGAAGLYTSYEAILMLSSKNELWAAYLYGGEVYYFSNPFQNNIPVAILNWSRNFKDAKFIKA